MTLLITMEFPLHDPDVPTIEISWPLVNLWYMYCGFCWGGEPELYSVIDVIDRIRNALRAAQVTNEGREVNAIWNTIVDTFEIKASRWTTQPDLALSFSYFLLRKQVIGRVDAAALAPVLLTHTRGNREPTIGEAISVDAWRLKIDRWAERQKPKLPPVGLTRGRPVQKKT